METADEHTNAPAAPAKAWHDELIQYHKDIEDPWGKQRKNVDRLYAPEERSDAADREYRIFWANIEVLKPAVYARPPVPVVTTRFKDAKPAGRKAAEVLERACVTTFDRSDIDTCLRELRDEYLLYGRGTARVRLGADHNGVPQVQYDHFTACDFAHGVGRTWNEVPWVGFRGWLTREEGGKRFGDVFAQVPLKRQDPEGKADSPKDKAPVWEIWCRKSRKVYFVNEDFADYLDVQDPWLDLSSFWPCPRPAYSTLIRGKLRPLPDFAQYKDQVEEINEYTARIAALSQALRVRGFYPAGASDLSEAIEAALKSIDDRAVMIPVSSQAMLGSQGFKDSIVWIPVVEILQVIQGLVELRRVVIDDVYQITGISDIVRGQTEASETATAQQIKAQWGSVRIRERQGELARFARDLTRMTAEIMAENFPPEILYEVAQVELPAEAQKQQVMMQMQAAQQYPMVAQQAQAMGMQPPPPPPEVPPEAQKMLEEPSAEEVAQFLANDRARGFVIDVETDSTIQPDEDAEKQRRMEFVETVGGLFQAAAPIVMQAPQLGPFMGEVLKFAADGFRAGRPLQGAIDQLSEMLEGMAQQAQIAAQQPPPPDPKVEAEKVKLEGVKAKTQADMAMAQAKQQQTVLDAQISQAEHQMTMEQMAAQQAAAAMMPPQGAE